MATMHICNSDSIAQIFMCRKTIKYTKVGGEYFEIYF